MDVRKTLTVTETFYKMLQELYQEKSNVSLLYDDKGMTRAEGFIKKFEDAKEQSFIELENGLVIYVKDIIAINGTFLSNYSEC